jgi:hypothetical protein
MKTKTLSETINDAQVMLNGIRAHEETLAKRNIDRTFVDDFQSEVDACINLNNEQEQLKALLKTKTNELNEKVSAMKKRASEARKIIKLDIPQTMWREFGIEDKR